jgi:hypothetical protein
VKVSGPSYVGVAVSATLFPLRLDLAPRAEAVALEALSSFLHPLTGGYQNRGWEFGRLPCLSDFYALLEAIPEVDHVANVTMLLSSITSAGKPAQRLVTEDRPLAVEMPQYALVFSGEHKMTLEALR